ncbi:hypothetical protein LTR49_028665, partial [Elasticomyces elasticus]
PEFARRDCPTTKTEKTTATDQEDGTRLIETVTTKKPGEIQLISGELGTPGLAGPKCRRQLGTNGASILRENKTIYNEAIAMLYRQNQFSLKSLSLTEFIKMLGDKIKALRHCKLDYINGYHQALRINLLADAENLQVLEIHSGVSTYCKTLEHVYGILKEPVVAFVSRGKTDVKHQDRFRRLRLAIDAERYRRNENGLVDHKGQEIKDATMAENIIRTEFKKRLITRGLLKENTGAPVSNEGCDKKQGKHSVGTQEQDCRSKPVYSQQKAMNSDAV